MYILLWKNKYGNIETIRTIRDNTFRDNYNNVSQLERRDKYLTIIHCDVYKIVYNSKTGWVNDK